MNAWIHKNLTSLGRKLVWSMIAGFIIGVLIALNCLSIRGLW